MAFCPNCGKQLNDGAAFCPDCGTAIANQNTQYQQQPQQPQYQQPQQPQYQQPQQPQYQQPQYQQPQYQQPYGQFQPQAAYQVKPKIPGRGFGITSMVLGIIALVCSISPLTLTIELSDSFLKEIDIVEEGLLSEFIIFGILGLLSVAFGVCAIVKNFKKGQAISGLIMGGLSLVMIVVSIILAI